MYLKIHKSYRAIVALCDSNLLGKKFESDKLQLDVRENFYKGEEITKEQAVLVLVKQAREDATFNIVGKEAVEAASEAGIIEKKHAGNIAGIPYALAL